jgi:hypothetical protein
MTRNNVFHLPVAPAPRSGKNSQGATCPASTASRLVARKSAAPITPEQLAAIMGDRAAAGLARAANDCPDLYEVFRHERPTFGEIMVAAFRRWSFRIGMACYVVAVAVAMYFAFQMGRGL